MTPGRKFSTTTSASFARRRKISLPSGALGVEGDRLLVAVLGEEARAHEPLVELRHDAELARQVAVLGVLDLDHLGAQQREVQRGERPGQHVGEVQDLDAFENALSHVGSVGSHQLAGPSLAGTPVGTGPIL